MNCRQRQNRRCNPPRSKRSHVQPKENSGIVSWGNVSKLSSALGTTEMRDSSHLFCVRILNNRKFASELLVAHGDLHRCLKSRLFNNWRSILRFVNLGAGLRLLRMMQVGRGLPPRFVPLLVFATTQVAGASLKLSSVMTPHLNASDTSHLSYCSHCGYISLYKTRMG